MKLWVVKVVYRYENEDWRWALDTDVKLFKKESDAIKALNDIIRSDWTTEVFYDISKCEMRLLADCPGSSEVKSCYESRWYYSIDKKTAWAYFTDGHGYKGEVVELNVN